MGAIGFIVIMQFDYFIATTGTSIFGAQRSVFFDYFVTFCSYIYTHSKEITSLSGKFLCVAKDYFSWDTLMVTMVIYRQLVATW